MVVARWARPRRSVDIRRRTEVVGRGRPAHTRVRRPLVLGLTLAALCGCASASAVGAGGAGPVGAGATPSKAARMVCSAEAQREIAGALGAATVGPVVPTWIDHRYSCTYPYRSGTVALSVKELPDAASTAAYFSSLQAALGAGGPVAGIGQGAYEAAGGSVVVRKDDKVLDVDVSGLGPSIGTPAVPRTEVGLRLAIVVMGCWSDR